MNHGPTERLVGNGGMHPGFFFSFFLDAFLGQYYLYKTDQNLYKIMIKNNYTVLKSRIINLIQ